MLDVQTAERRVCADADREPRVVRVPNADGGRASAVEVIASPCRGDAHVAVLPVRKAAVEKGIDLWSRITDFRNHLDGAEAGGAQLAHDVVVDERLIAVQRIGNRRVAIACWLRERTE